MYTLYLLLVSFFQPLSFVCQTFNDISSWAVDPQIRYYLYFLPVSSE